MSEPASSRPADGRLTVPSNLSRGSPSLLLRLTLSALAVLALALGLIGTAVDRAFRAAEEVALAERLESAVFQVLAGIEVNEDGSLEITANLGDSLLSRPGSGLYAGIETNRQDWLSPSSLGAEFEFDVPMLPRGAERLQLAEDGPLHHFQLGLGWEQADGEILDLTVWAAEDRARMAGSIRSFRTDLWRWLGLAGIVLLVAQLVLLAQPLLVLRRVAGEVQQVEAGQLEALRGRYPRELTPLTENLNALLQTERANAEQYQSALGDLAHSLKTPLAVLSAQLENLDASPEELRESVQQMQYRIRSELDRAARSGRRTMLAPLDVAAPARRLLQSLEKLYPNVDFELDVEPGTVANVAERDLVELVGNLAENAAKYGDGVVTVELQAGEASARRRGLRLRVIDNGPGLTSDAFSTLLQRGVRGDERGEGQGFGLSIVERIVASYHGELEAGRTEKGLFEVRVELKPE